MARTPEEIQAAIQRAQAAGDDAAVARLQARLQSAQNAGQGGSPAPAAKTAPEPQKPFERAGGGGPTLAGARDAIIKTGLGVKQIFGGLSDEQKAVLEQMKLEQEADPEGGWRTAGDIGAQVATSVLPGVGAVGKAGNIVKSPILRAALSAGAQGAVLTPTSGDTYAEQMGNKAIEGAKGAVLGGALQALVKPVRGLFQATPEAEKLFKQGVSPSLQQAAASKTGKLIGGLTSGSLDTKSRLRDEGGRALVKRITEGNVDVPEGTGREFADHARNYLDDAYNQVWQGKRVNLSPAARREVMDTVSAIPRDGRGSLEAGQAAKVMSNRLGDSTTNQRFSMEKFRKEFRNKITRDAMDAAGDVRDRLLAGREALDNKVTNAALSPDELRRVSELNRLNFDSSRLDEAVAGAQAGKEGVDFTRLSAAYDRMRNQGAKLGVTTKEDLVDPLSRTLSLTPNQNASRSLLISLSRAGLPLALVGGAFGGTGGAAGALAVPYGLSLLGQTGKGSKALTGQYEVQKQIAEILRNMKVNQAIGGAVTGATGEY